MKRVLATLIFFTRLPLWRICEIEKKYYERVVPLWPMVGWVTGALMMGVYSLASMVFPVGISVVLALVSRLLLTGALHEDGFADFCDGFGGGTSRQRVLEIMKDSHIGTYGVLGLILYYLLLWQLLTALLSSGLTPWVMVCVDAFCKYLASTIVYFLPYARKEEEAKNRLIYASTPWSDRLLSLLLGVLPTLLVCVFAIGFDSISLFAQQSPLQLVLGIVLPILLPAVLCLQLFLLMRRRISGYTGDCCGATFILAELCCYLAIMIFLSISFS